MKRRGFDRISLENFFSENEVMDFFSNHNLTMLFDDLKFSRYRLKDGKLSINIIFDSGKIQEEFIIDKLRNIFNIHKSFWREELNEIILTAIENIWQNFISDGYIVFEKVKDFESNKIELHKIEGIFSFDKNYIIQKAVLDNKKIIKIKIPNEKCYILKFPDEICNYKDYRKMLKEIANIGKKEPMFSVLSRTKLNQSEGYDYIEHKKKLDEILYRITKKISWDFRDRYSKEFSNYYMMRRNLIFNKNKVIILNHIINFLSAILLELIPEVKFKFDYAIKISNFEEEIKKLEEGNYSTKEFTNLIISSI